jgi:hypothetical protein
MEIVVKHTITLDPEVIALLKGFSGGHQAPAPVKEMTSSPAKAGKAAKSEAAKEEVKQEVAAPAEQLAPVVTAPKVEAPEISFSDIRQLYLEKKDQGKQEKVKAILDEYGVKKLSEFKPDQFEEVYNKIKAA